MVGSKEAEAAADVFSALATKVQLRLRWWINCYLAVLSLKNSSAEINEPDVAPQHHTVTNCIVHDILNSGILSELKNWNMIFYTE